MGYDPQRGQRRVRPAEEDTAPVDALLGDADVIAIGAPSPSGTPGVVPDDPPPTPAVTPEPADPPSDRLLLNSVLAAIAGTVVVMLVLRQLWVRRKR